MVSLRAKEVFCLIYSGLLFISGLILIGVSAYLLFKLFNHYTFIPSGNVGPFFVIFVLGILHLFLTWLGVKGPTREHNFHIIMFMAFTVVLLACEFAVGVWSIILWDDMEVGSIDLLTESFQQHLPSIIENKNNGWKKLQNKFHCCGINGYKDYNTTALPASCFIDVHKTQEGLFLDGCKLPLIRYVKRILIDAAIIGFICAVFQGVGIFTFCTFFKTLREERSERLARRLEMQREIASVNASSVHQVPVGMAPVPPSGTGSPPPSTPPVTTTS